MMLFLARCSKSKLRAPSVLSLAPRFYFIMCSTLTTTTFEKPTVCHTIYRIHVHMDAYFKRRAINDTRVFQANRSLYRKYSS